MPYPPPSGPPELGIFQGIGLVPELPALVGNYFLTNNAGLTVWSPVAGGVLPDETGHAGQFLTTDGMVANWTPLPPTPYSTFDIRNYGAISAADTFTAALAVNDCTSAIRSAIAAATQVATQTQFRAAGPAPEVYVPTGNWYISGPIVFPANTKVFGDGPQYSNIVVGPGTPATPSLVQGFAGPMFYLGGFQSAVTPGNGLPSYTSPLVGVTGQSMVMTTFDPVNPTIYPPSMFLDDSYAWSTFLMWHAAELSLQCWVKATAWSDGNRRSIIGSTAFNALSGDASAVALYATSNGTSVFYNAVLQTSITGLQTITSSACTAGTAYNLEIDYDGAHFDFFVGGVSQGHVAMTGRVLKNPLDCSTLGDAGNELQGLTIYQITGAVDSIRLSNTARHTGTGSFTPPVAKYAWDSNTLWLCNFDQTAPTSAMPFLQAQAAIQSQSNFFPAQPSPATAASPAPTVGGPNPHFMRFGGWTVLFMQFGGAANSVVRDVQLMGGLNASGLYVYGANNVDLENLWTAYTCAWGQYLNEPFSFFSGMNNCAASFGVQAGTAFLPERGAYNIFSRACGVGQVVTAGQYISGQDASGWNSYIPFVFGGIGGLFSPLQASLCGIDSEGVFPYVVTGAFVLGDSQLIFSGNSWQTQGASNPVPSVLYSGGAANGAIHIGDAFSPSPGGVGISTLHAAPTLEPGAGARTVSSILAIGCLFTDRNRISDIPGLVAEISPSVLTNQVSLSTTATSGKNLAGTFTIQYGYSSGGPTFPAPEPDARYIVDISYKGYVGSAPAAGSTVPGPYTTSTTGFVMDQGVTQTGTCTTIWSYTVIRTAGDPLGFDYLPSLPTTLTNPLATVEPTGFPWFVGGTLVPATGHTFRYNNTIGDEVVFEAGTPSTNWWQLKMNNGATLAYAIDSTAVGGANDSFVSNGKLYGLANPGTHNVVLGISNSVPGLVGLGTSTVYVDGGLNTFFYGTGQSAGTQQTPIQLGQHAGGTELLGTATLRNVKVDTSFSQVVTYEQDAGPQAGNTIGAFFGDEWTLGFNAGAAGLGGFATQVAENRYGTTYYWLAAQNSGTFLGSVLPQFWQQWGTNQTLVGMCLLAGFNDLLGGATAASIWSGMQLMLNGTPATATFTPPVQNTIAFGIYVPPLTAATATCVIDGISFNVTVAPPADRAARLTACNTLVAAVAADVTLGPLLTSTINNDPAQANTPLVLFQATGAPGYAGNAITTTTDGGGGAFWYPGTTFTGGGNSRLTIQGVQFEVVFDTDADTTVNDLIALITASGPTIALVTPTLVSHQLLLTAVTSGTVGNAITVTSNNALGSTLAAANLVSGTLVGGADGAIQKGVNPIVLCTVPPFGQAPGYTAGKDAQRVSLNGTISAFVGAGVTIADVDVAVRDPGAHQNINPTYLAADNVHLNDAGHAAMYTLINPLLP